MERNREAVRIILPKRWSRARRKAARAVIRYDVAKMAAIDRYTDTLFRIQAEARELFAQQVAEVFMERAR